MHFFVVWLGLFAENEHDFFQPFRLFLYDLARLYLFDVRKKDGRAFHHFPVIREMIMIHLIDQFILCIMCQSELVKCDSIDHHLLAGQRLNHDIYT